MAKANLIRGDEILVHADASVFSREIILKALYWYGDKFHTTISIDGNCYDIRLKSMPNISIKEGDLEYYLQKIERDLIDYHLREIVNRETMAIRELLVAKAFSNGEFDEPPQGNISDAVGFDPLLIQQ